MESTDVPNDPCCDAGHVVRANTSVHDSKASYIVTLDGASGLDMQIINGTGSNSKFAIVIAYDIFGPRSPNMIANLQHLASTGYTVCMPDFFRGHSASELGELNPDKIGAFIKEHGDQERAGRDLESFVLPHLRSLGVEKCYLLGFCWGGLIAVRVSSSLVSNSLQEKIGFAGVGGIHASLKDEGWTLEQLKSLRCPIILLQAANDKPVEPLKIVLDCGNFSGKYVLRTYFDQTHGFAGARGDRSKPLVLAAALSALNTSLEFFSFIGSGEL